MTTLDIQIEGRVARVFLNRPEVRNAFNDGVIMELAETFTRLGNDPGLRAIVLGGHGKAFCAGADLNWMKSMAGYGWEDNRADATRLRHVLLKALLDGIQFTTPGGQIKIKTSVRGSTASTALDPASVSSAVLVEIEDASPGSATGRSGEWSAGWGTRSCNWRAPDLPGSGSATCRKADGGTSRRRR